MKDNLLKTGQSSQDLKPVFYLENHQHKPKPKSYPTTGATPFIFFDIKKPVFYSVNGLVMGVAR